MGFGIKLDSDKVVPGGGISGRVVVQHQDEKKIRGLFIECYGKEKTRWKEGKTTISDEKLLYRAELRPIGNGILPPGLHQFPFSFLLHPDLPATFHGKYYGSIKYKVKAKLDIILEIDDDDVVEFIVLSMIDLNARAPQLDKPIAFTEVKEISNWGCGGDTSISLDLKLRKQGFALGEMIEMVMFCENTSDVAISNFDIELHWTTIYKAGSTCEGEYRTKKEKEILSKLTGRGVPSFETRTYQLNFGIPTNFGLPNFIGCELFQSKCKLKVTGITDGLHFNLTLKAPLTIGHKAYINSRRPSPVNLAPIGGTSVPFVPVPLSKPDSNEFATIAPSAPTDYSPALTPPYSGDSTTELLLPPPSYDEAMRSNNK